MIIVPTSSQAARNKVVNYSNRSGVTDPVKLGYLLTFLEALYQKVGKQYFHAIYPFIGGTSVTNSYNLASEFFQINWFGTVVHTSNGALGNGSTGYGDTGYIYSNNTPQDNLHISLYSRSQTPGDGSTFIGALTSGGGAPRIGVNRFGSKVSADGLNANLTTPSDTLFVETSTDLRGQATACRTASNVQAIYWKQVAPTTDTTASSGNVSNSIYVCARNNAGTADNFSTDNIAFASMGLGLNAGQVSVLHTLVQNLQIALGRSV